MISEAAGNEPLAVSISLQLANSAQSAEEPPHPLHLATADRLTWEGGREEEGEKELTSQLSFLFESTELD